jgi:N-acetylglucosaminyldiphosphoundecaprenol N-acetyl-beta-D-mannosaminyltransferase
MNINQQGLEENTKTIRFLGLPLHCVSYQDTFQIFDKWINTRPHRGRSVALINVNCCVSGLLDRNVRRLYQQADLLGIDSMPFLHIARLFKNKSSDRLYAPDMMLEAAKESQRRGYKFFLYGGAEGAPETMANFLKSAHPDVQIAGTLSPPFRQQTAEEDEADCRTILESGANIVWVGLGSPKQDLWIADHCDKLPGCILIASGATFDFFSGRIKQAPRLIRNIGFEWLFRLFQDPQRLWKRYTLYNFLFLGAILLEVTGLLRLTETPRSREEMA